MIVYFMGLTLLHLVRTVQNRQARCALKTARREPVVALCSLTHIGVAIVGIDNLRLCARKDNEKGEQRDNLGMCHGCG